MGLCVGFIVGKSVVIVGLNDGDSDSVGFRLGWVVGINVGLTVGFSVLFICDMHSHSSKSGFEHFQLTG